LHLHPYKITSLHGLKAPDNVKRVEYCRWFRDVIAANGGDILEVTFFASEALFHLSDYENSQNSRVWSATDPHVIKDTPLHERRLVWCAVSRNLIIGSIHFDGTIKSERYCEVILYPSTGHLNEDEIAHGHFQ
jgi:hypothetical protein